jgi:ribosomal RNA-processing protein 12
VYLKLCEPALCAELFERAFGRLENTEESDFMKESVLDLLRVLLPYQASENIAKLFDLMKSRIGETEDFKRQKKYYRYAIILDLLLAVATIKIVI